MKYAIVTLLTGLLTLLAAPLRAADPIDIGSRRELFVDHHLIELLRADPAHPRLGTLEKRLRVAICGIEEVRRIIEDLPRRAVALFEDLGFEW